jgi:hypothetical protein
MSETAITSLAILKVNWETSRRDYIANFVPFVSEALRTAPQDEVALPDLQKTVETSFGLRIPRGALKTILGRLAKNGAVSVRQGIYRRNATALDSTAFLEARTKALREHDVLVTKLTTFCRDEHGVDWSDEEADAALLSYLQERSAPVLAAAVEGAPLPVPTTEVRDADYLVNAFIVHLHQTDLEGFEALETVVKGSMLASVLYYPNLGEIDQRLDQVSVYLDTRVLLQALGIGGEFMRESRKEFFQLLYDLGADLKCFEETALEMRVILENAARALRRGTTDATRTHGLVDQQLADAGYTPTDVELLIEKLPRRLAALRVQIVPRPAPDRRFTIDESKFEVALRQGVHYPRDEPLHHDLNAATAIYRLRRGRVRHRLEETPAIFVTTNTPFVRATHSFFRDECAYKGVPICVADHVFETLVWLKRSVDAPELPRKRILADSLAALRPDETLWRKYLQEITRLRERDEIEEDDFLILRDSIEARVELMNVTRGDIEAFSEGTVKEVLDQAISTLKGEADAELKAVRTDLRKEEAHRRRQRERVERFASVASHRIAQVLLYGSVLVFAGLAYLTLPESYAGLAHRWSDLIAPVVFAAVWVVAVSTVASTLFGWSLQGTVRSFERWLERRLHDLAARVIQP